MKITCSAKRKSGSEIAIMTDAGQLVDSFPAPTRNGLLYCMSKTYGKYTRRLKHGIEIAETLEKQPAPEAANDDHQNQRLA